MNPALTGRQQVASRKHTQRRRNAARILEGLGEEIGLLAAGEPARVAQEIQAIAGDAELLAHRLRRILGLSDEPHPARTLHGKVAL